MDNWHRLRRSHTAIIGVATTVLAATTVVAQDRAPAAKADDGRRGAFSVVLENDLFAGNDNNYTNGFSLLYTSAPVSDLEPDRFVARTARAFSFLPTVDEDGYQTYVTYRLSQEMYTPPDISLPAPLPGDQPYAGVLLADLSLYTKSQHSLHTFILAVGVVGPASGAEQAQKFVHELIDSEEPMGWDTQLDNELLLNIAYAYDRRFWRKAPSKAFGWDLTGSAGGAAGNYLTNAFAEALLRLGYDLPDTYGIHSIRGGGGGGPLLSPPPEGWRIYGTLGLTAAGYARFLPTDGNTFSDSLSGDREDFYSMWSSGLTVAYRKFSIAYNYAVIFGDRQRPGDTSDDYGTLSLSWYF